MRLTDEDKIARTAEMIADHIAEARNYVATLESICKRAATDKDLLLQHSQFFATVKTALWGALILHLHHCLDQRREALGFHCLLRQIRAYIPQDGHLVRNIDQGFKALCGAKEAQAVRRWRSEMVAHDHQSYGRFLQDVPCDFRDIDRLLAGCEHLLAECRRTFPALRIPRVLAFHKKAEPSVAEVMEALRMTKRVPAN